MAAGSLIAVAAGPAAANAGAANADTAPATLTASAALLWTLWAREDGGAVTDAGRWGRSSGCAASKAGTALMCSASSRELCSCRAAAPAAEAAKASASRPAGHIRGRWSRAAGLGRHAR